MLSPRAAAHGGGIIVVGGVLAGAEMMARRRGGNQDGGMGVRSAGLVGRAWVAAAFLVVSSWRAQLGWLRLWLLQGRSALLGALSRKRRRSFAWKLRKVAP